MNCFSQNISLSEKRSYAVFSLENINFDKHDTGYLILIIVIVSE
jgi:hypothetical protein